MLLDRREALNMILAAGLGIAVGRTLESHHVGIEITPPIASPNLGAPRGETVQGGELLDADKLIGAYNQIITSDKPMELDASMVRSTVYHAARFYGSLHEKALEQTNRITISPSGLEICDLGTAGCSYRTRQGMEIEVVQKALESKTFFSRWVNLLEILSHETYHATVDLDATQVGTDDFGVFGTSFRGSREGFILDSQNSHDTVNAITRTIRLDDKYQPRDTFMLEEFGAEYGKIRFIKALQQQGLELPNHLKADNLVAYGNLTESLANIQNSTPTAENKLSWQQFWGEELSAKQIDLLHSQNQPWDFYFRAGQSIKRVNPSSDDSLSKGDIAAVGLVGFSDFLEHGLTHYKVFNSLITEPLTRENIVSQAGKLLYGKAKSGVNHL